MACLRKLLFTALFVGSVFPSVTIAAANTALDNILISKTSGVATVQIWPACRMRYVDHSPFDAGVELRIRVSMSPECAALLDGVVAERYSPSSLRLGGVEEVIFERFNPRDTFILLRFRDPQKFEIRQHSVGWIEVYVDTNVDSASLPSTTAIPPPAANPSNATSSMLGSLANRPARPIPSGQIQPSNRVNVSPSSTGDFVVQLGVFEDADRAVRALRATSTGHLAYRTDLVINDTTWHGLQLGFFDSEVAAEQVANQLRDDFPDIWVRYVDQDEALDARAAGDLRDNMQDEVVAVRVRSDIEMSGEQITALVAEGRRALLEQRYDDAVRLYTRAIEAPDHPHRAEAREMLGIAFERSGRSENAVAEYRVFLDDFPEELGAARVSGRLSALETAYPPPSFAIGQNDVKRADADSWQIYGGVSTYYWRNQEQLVHDGNYLVSSSGVLTLGDISASRRGERFDVLARLNGAYQVNLLDFDATGDIGWVSTAFVDVHDNQTRLRGRIGRQNRREDGVLGRFDGAGIGYQWKPNLYFSVSGGIPVDSPRYISDSNRYFYAASAKVEDLWGGRISASAYTQHQVVDSISDRQAVGGEVLYRGDAVSVFSLLDFDVSYNVLNTALVNATWQLDNGWSLSGRMDFGAEPYLTTRNALAGQTARTVDELLETFSEGQVRRLARDRTSQATALSIGVSAPIGEKFDLSLDATMRQVDATVTSGSVDAQPDTGNEFFLNATIVATSLLLDNDLLLVSFRYDALRTSDVSQLMLDSRLPISRSTRISPRLIVTHRDTLSNNSTQTIVTPSVRVLLRWGNVLFDLEAGGRWSNRDLPPLEFDPFTPDGTEELLGGFVNLGYRWEF